MAADTHGPSPRGLLCNAGAGAAAGMFVFLCLRAWDLVVFIASFTSQP